MGFVAFLGFQLVEIELEVVQNALDIFLEIEMFDGLVLVATQLGFLVVCEEEVEVGVLDVGFELLGLVSDFRCVEEKDASEHEELYVADLEVLVEVDAL